MCSKLELPGKMSQKILWDTIKVMMAISGKCQVSNIFINKGGRGTKTNEISSSFISFFFFLKDSPSTYPWLFKNSQRRMWFMPPEWWD